MLGVRCGFGIYSLAAHQAYIARVHVESEAGLDRKDRRVFGT